MSARGAISRGGSSVKELLKLLLLLALVAAIVGPVLWFFPLGGLRSFGHPPPSGRDWLLLGTLLSTTGVAAFMAGVVGPWCDSLLRAVLCGAAISQVVVLPLMRFVPAGWTDQAAGWGVWLLFTAIGIGALWRYWSSIDRSWRSHFS